VLERKRSSRGGEGEEEEEEGIGRDTEYDSGFEGTGKFT
jgi:hypothetical protein